MYTALPIDLRNNIAHRKETLSAREIVENYFELIANERRRIHTNES